MIFKFF